MDEGMRSLLVRIALEQARQEAGEPWWLQKKTFADGRVAYLHQTLFNLRISISRDEHDVGFNEFYCFHDSSAAFVAMATWDGTGDPEGWVRHGPSNRRRPNGDPDEEFVAP